MSAKAEPQKQDLEIHEIAGRTVKEVRMTRIQTETTVHFPEGPITEDASSESRVEVIFTDGTKVQI